MISTAIILTIKSTAVVAPFAGSLQSSALQKQYSVVTDVPDAVSVTFLQTKLSVTVGNPAVFAAVTVVASTHK